MEPEARREIVQEIPGIRSREMSDGALKKCPSLTRPKFSPRIAPALRETRSEINLPRIWVISR